MAPAFRTFDASHCKGSPLPLQCLAVALISALPVALSLALSGGSLLAAALALALVLAPRLLWQVGQPTDGSVFFIALGVYWNVVYATCFASPLIIAACCLSAPRWGLPATALYVLWTQVRRHELRDGRPWRWFSQHEWGYHAFRHFVQLTLRLPESLLQLPPTSPVIFAVHPHGIASDYRILMDGILYEALPGREVLALAASVLFKLPLVRELALWTRCIDASRSVAERALRKGHSLMVLPGGEREQIRTRFQKEEVFLPSIGFVRLALKGEAALVPCYVFGCVDSYKTYSILHGPREWLRKKFRVCIPVYSGSIGVLPRRVPLAVVFGEPLQLPRCTVAGEPSGEEVEAAFRVYVSALKELFDKNKAEFGYGDRELTIEFPEMHKKS